MKYLVSCCVLCLIAFVSVAQPYGDSKFKQKFNKADALTYDGSYMEALPLLEEMYAFDTSNANLNYLLGICYLMGKNDHSLAIKRLESATKDVSLEHSEANWKERKAPGLAYLYLGKAYHFKNQFDRAVTNYYNYRSFIEMDDVATYNKVRQLIQYAENAMELVKNPVGVKVTNLGPTINTKYPDYCPVISADGGTLIFTSRREGGTGGAKDEDGNYYDDIYICSRQSNGSWSKPKSIGSNINTAGHEAAIGLSPDGQLLFIYKDDNGDGNIYYSSRNGDDWTAPQRLGSDINTPAWETHATVTATQDKLIFVSNRSVGGYGGRDLWFCNKLPNGDWGLAINMGSVINSEYEEDSPFISGDGKTLIFSSQGHTSMGGFDILRSEFEDGAWSVPENIGYPINTSEDDVFFVLNPDGRTAYYSSRKDGGFGDADLYQLKLELKKTKSAAVARGVMKVPAMAYADISAKIVVTDEGGAQIGTYRPSPSTGFYVLILNPGESYSISYEADGYEPIIATLQVEDNKAYDEYEDVIQLKEVVFGENILALQKETERLEKEKQAAIAKAAEDEKLAEIALAKAKEEEEKRALFKDKESEKQKAEELAAKEKLEAEKALAAEEEKLKQAKLDRERAEKEAVARAKAKSDQELAASNAAEEEARIAQAAAELAMKKEAEEKALAEQAAAENEAIMAAELAAKEKSTEEEKEKELVDAHAEQELASNNVLEEVQSSIVPEETVAEEIEVSDVEADNSAVQEEFEKAEKEALKRQAELAESEKVKSEEERLAKQAAEAVVIERERLKVEEESKLAQKEAAEKAAAELALKSAVETKSKAEQDAAEIERAERIANAEKKRIELMERIQELKDKQEENGEVTTANQGKVKEVSVAEVGNRPLVDNVNAEEIQLKRESMLARIEELKKRRSEVEDKAVEDEIVVSKAEEKVKTAIVEKEHLEVQSEKKTKEISELETELELIGEKVVEAKVAVEEAKVEKAVAEEVLLASKEEEVRLAEEERRKTKEALEAEKQLKEIEREERERLLAEKLAAEQTEREERAEAERAKRELIQLEAVAEQQRQVKAAMEAEERKKVLIEAAEKDAYSQEEILSNTNTLVELRELNKKLIEDNLDLRKELAELNRKLDMILARLDYAPEAGKVEMPSSATMKNLQEGKRLILRNIFFDYNLASLRSNSKHELNKLFDFMKANPEVEIVVSGHTDSRGNDDYNLRLSQDRAQAVVDYLIRNGISSKRLSAKGYGETRPIARNENSDLSDNAVGRQLNRRIEISMPEGALKGVEMEPVEVPNEAKIK